MKMSIFYLVDEDIKSKIDKKSTVHLGRLPVIDQIIYLVFSVQKRKLRKWKGNHWEFE